MYSLNFFSFNMREKVKEIMQQLISTKFSMIATTDKHQVQYDFKRFLISRIEINE